MKEFANIAAFAEHLLTLDLAIAESIHRGLERAALRIERNAKRRIGHYHRAVGPFPAWARLAVRTEQEKARLGYPLKSPLVREGDLRDSIEHEVSGMEAVIGSKSPIAAYQEFGTNTIPPRPFIGPAAFKNKEAIQRILGKAMVEGIMGGTAAPAALGYDFET